jgi:hypothetical protein
VQKHLATMQAFPPRGLEALANHKEMSEKVSKEHSMAK